MRNPRTILAMLLSVALASTAAMAGMQHIHSSTDDFSWSADGHSVSMHSDNRSGVVVDRTAPTAFHGLQTGDVILAIDKQPVAHVSDLLNALRNHARAPATLQVRRAGAELALSWTYAECQALVPLPPPPPPPPPAPPPPPPHS